MSSVLVTGLSVAGALALIFRLVGTTGRWLLLAAEVTLADGRVEVNARRGDLTGLAESRTAARDARRARRLTGAAVLALILALVLPLALALPWIYAIAALLWLLPRSPRSPSR